MENKGKVYFAYCGFCLRTLKSANMEEIKNETVVNFRCRCGKEFKRTIKSKKSK